MKPINVLSLFNGLSCGRLALERAGIPVAKYYESEIDPYAGKVSAYNWPESVQIGDVRNVVVKELPFVPDLLIAGSPCQGFSYAGKQLNFSDPRSALFFEFVRILKECQALNPNVLYMLENVPMKKEFQRVINEALGIMPVTINGALVSAQNRNRLFWTNIKTRRDGLFGDLVSAIPQPADKGILLKDILETDVDEKYFLSDTAMKRILSNMSYLHKKESFGVINNDGILSEVDQANCIDASYAKGMDNHGQRTLAVVVQKVDVLGLPKANQEKADCYTAGGNSAGNHSQMDLIMCVSQRGRHINENGNRVDTKGADTVQRIEVAKDPTKMNTVTSEAKDGLVYIGTPQAPSLWGKQPRQQDRVNDGYKARCVPSQDGGRFTKSLVHGRIRRLTPTEVCRLFNVPDGYFHDKDGKRLVSESQQYKALGNGWVVDVIAHIFSFIPEALK